MAVLLWVKSKKSFLKIQEGTGDNLSIEDVANDFSYYVLWFTFRPSELDIDERKRTVKKYLTVQTEETRSIGRHVDHYNLVNLANPV